MSSEYFRICIIKHYKIIISSRFAFVNLTFLSKNRIIPTMALRFYLALFLLFRLTRLMWRSKFPLLISSVRTYCSNVGTVHE